MFPRRATRPTASFPDPRHDLYYVRHGRAPLSIDVVPYRVRRTAERERTGTHAEFRPRAAAERVSGRPARVVFTEERSGPPCGSRRRGGRRRCRTRAPSVSVRRVSIRSSFAPARRRRRGSSRRCRGQTAELPRRSFSGFSKGGGKYPDTMFV